MSHQCIARDRAGNIKLAKFFIPVTAGGVTWGFFTFTFAFELALPAAIIAGLIALIKVH